MTANTTKPLQTSKRRCPTSLYETPSYAWNNLGWSYYKKGDYDSAATAFMQAVKLDLNAVNRAAFENNAGRALLAKKDIDGAIAHFTKALKSSPDYVGTAILAGKELSGTE